MQDAPDPRRADTDVGRRRSVVGSAGTVSKPFNTLRSEACEPVVVGPTADEVVARQVAETLPLTSSTCSTTVSLCVARRLSSRSADAERGLGMDLPFTWKTDVNKVCQQAMLTAVTPGEQLLPTGSSSISNSRSARCAWPCPPPRAG